MKFICNKTEYEIKEVEHIELTEEIMGQTRYQEKTILLKQLSRDVMIKTLKHELMHVWLYEYGHAQNDDTKYNYEDICEIVACSNDFINEVVEQYIQRNQKTYIENKNWNDLSEKEKQGILKDIEKRPLQILPL